MNAQDQLHSLIQYRSQMAGGTLSHYLDGAIAAFEWANDPESFISIAEVISMGVDPSAPLEPAKPKLSVVRNG